ncbi:hypothetical protein thsps21_26870 [Pseudomonas sp. No.21]|jgi:hypothetical protein|nr:hypothetical protein DMX10_07770 [Pseudomonas sp. 57B-090624]GJN45175.1 hypothetical protein TUM20249_11610 [Pseudomonas tohonis]
MRTSMKVLAKTLEQRQKAPFRRGVWRSQSRMQGSATFLWFGIPTIEKGDSPGKAKLKTPAELETL